MIIAVLSCKAHLEREESQRATWAKDYPVLWFKDYPPGLPDMPLLPKLQAMLRSKYVREADYVFKADTDAYIALDRLLEHYGRIRFYCDDYVGQPRLDFTSVYAYGGPGFWMSRKAINILANAPDPTDHDWDDRWVGDVMRDNNIHLQGDHRYSIYTPCLPANSTITQHLTGNAPFTPEMMHEAHRRYCDSRP